MLKTPLILGLSAYIYVVVQFYPWFNFDFPLFFFYANTVYMLITIRQRKIKIEPRVRLNCKLKNKLGEHHFFIIALLLAC